MAKNVREIPVGSAKYLLWKILCAHEGGAIEKFGAVTGEGKNCLCSFFKLQKFCKVFRIFANPGLDLVISNYSICFYQNIVIATIDFDLIEFSVAVLG